MAPSTSPIKSPTKTSSRNSSISKRTTPSKIFNALLSAPSDPSPALTEDTSATIHISNAKRDTMSTITMGSLMNELNNAAMSVDTSGTAPSARPQLSARSNSGALDMNLQTTLAGITASQKSINQALNKVRSAKAMAAEKVRKWQKN